MNIWSRLPVLICIKFSIFEFNSYNLNLCPSYQKQTQRAQLGQKVNKEILCVVASKPKTQMAKKLRVAGGRQQKAFPRRLLTYLFFLPVGCPLLGEKRKK